MARLKGTVVGLPSGKCGGIPVNEFGTPLTFSDAYAKEFELKAVMEIF